jgi:hypothetical protein
MTVGSHQRAISLSAVAKTKIIRVRVANNSDVHFFCVCEAPRQGSKTRAQNKRPVPEQQRNDSQHPHKMMLLLFVVMVASCAAFSAPVDASNGPHAHKISCDPSISNGLEWLNDNLLIIESEFPSKRMLFKQLIPLQPGGGYEVKACYQSPWEGAKELVDQLKPRLHKDEMTNMLESSLSHFAQIAKPYSGSSLTFEAKLRFSRGKSGAKCPRWHFDNVPVRWIQALVGPGCDFVLGEAGVMNRDKKDWFKPRKKNGKCDRVDETVANIRRCTNGEATVLKGLKGSDTMKPAIHKSPIMNLMEGRVLLVIDIIENDPSELLFEPSCTCTFDHH